MTNERCAVCALQANAMCNKKSSLLYSDGYISNCTPHSVRCKLFIAIC